MDEPFRRIMKSISELKEIMLNHVDKGGTVILDKSSRSRLLKVKN